jgi:site-specific DNA-methyltransferase (adenine-specific)
MNIDLRCGDCLELMKDIPDKSIDMVLCDLPYGTTTCKWDVVIPFEFLWGQYNRIVKDNGAIVLFSKQPFTTELIHSNLKNFKYTLIWKKDNHDNPLMAKKRFLNITEDVNIFYKKQCVYNPQGIIKVNKVTKQGRGESLSQKNTRKTEYLQEYTNYPRNILEFKRDLPNVHPTQKPVALLEFLIKTYTNENDVVLDNCMGSGSTGVACVNTNRRFIGIELDKAYFEIAKNRIENKQLNEQLNIYDLN